MDDNQKTNDELAQLTDAILEHRDMKASEELLELESVVMQLQDVIKPDVPPTQAYRARLTQRLMTEWTMQQQTKRQRRYIPQIPRVFALAASFAIVLLAVLLLLSQDANLTPPVGTAIGSSDAVIVFLLLAAVGAAGFFIWRRRK